MSPTSPSRNWLGFGPRPLANPWLYPALGAFVLLACLSVRKISDFDFGYHLANGQWMVENRQVLSHEVFTFTAPDLPFEDIHWLFQILLYGFYRLGGYGLLSLLNTGLILGAFALLLKRMGDLQTPAWASGPLLTLALLACERRFQVRPEIPTWVLLGLTLWVLESRAGHRRDRLALLPFLQLAWVNLEGLFPLGWMAMGGYLIGPWLKTRRPDWKLMRYAGLSLLCDLANPGFLKGALFPFIYMKELGPGSALHDTIFEFQSPWVLWKTPGVHPEVAVYGVFSALLAALLLATWRRREPQDFLLAAAFFGLAFQANRNISIFLIATAPLAGACVRDLGWNGAVFGRRKGLEAGAALALSLALLATALRAATGAYFTDLRIPEQAGLGVDGGELPVAGAAFLAQNHLDGRILNHLNSAGWLIWQGHKVYIDGHHEALGPERFGEYLSAGQPGGLARLLEKENADILFFPPNVLYSGNWTLQLSRMPDWRLVYLDAASAIYLRNGYAPQVPALTGQAFLKGLGVPLPDPATRAALLSAPRVSPFELFWSGFSRPPPYPRGLLVLGGFCSWYGKPDWAEPLFLEALRLSQGRFNEAYSGLATLYYLLHRFGEAQLCVGKILERDPGNATARRLLAAMGAAGARAPQNP